MARIGRWLAIFAVVVTGLMFGCGSDSNDDGKIPEGMVMVPKGTFKMGCNGNEGGATWDCLDAEPLHEIDLDTYYMDVYEVTAAQYKACVDAGKCTPATGSNTAAGKENHPINGVTWAQASAYCASLDKRLPTEAEWEKAARGTDQRVFPWGNTRPSCEKTNFWCKWDWCANSGPSGQCVGETSAVGAHPTGGSPYGIYDAAGNVYEWVNDWHSAAYYAASPASNPPGPASGTQKIIRGGAWNGTDANLRCAYRAATDPALANDSIGFRCAKAF